mmetsp:Transcript_50926/g.161016  ORF Transcript_50926/g.161016 Transcript_50926/m.161016 type:complete len:344 (+) Transcript_50926:24-1055(+)
MSLVLATVAALRVPASCPAEQRPFPSRHRPPRAAPRLCDLPQRPRGKSDGFYVRPSAAVEKGGAFFVPGLEGFRLKLLAASVLGLALVANRLASPGEPASSQLVSEALGAAACAQLLLQVAAEAQAGRDEAAEQARALASARLSERLEVSPALDASRSSRAQWAAATLLRQTAASAVALYALPGGAAGGGGARVEPLLRSGRLPSSAALPSGEALAASLAESGGLYVPEAAVAAKDLALPQTAGSAVLQRCGDDAAFLPPPSPSAVRLPGLTSFCASRCSSPSRSVPTLSTSGRGNGSAGWRRCSPRSAGEGGFVVPDNGHDSQRRAWSMWTMDRVLDPVYHT